MIKEAAMCKKNFPEKKFYLDTSLYTISEGTSEMHKIVINIEGMKNKISMIFSAKGMKGY